MKENNLTDLLVTAIKNNKFAAIVIVIALFTIGLGAFTESLDSIITFAENRLLPKGNVTEETQKNSYTQGLANAIPTVPAEAISDSLRSAEKKIDALINTAETSNPVSSNNNLMNNNDSINLENVIPETVSEPNILTLEANANEESIDVIETPKAVVEEDTDKTNSDEVSINNADETDEFLSEEYINSRYRFALAIPYASDRSNALLALAKLASDNRHFKVAIDLAKDIPYTATKSEAFSYIARTAYKNNELDYAFEAADLIPYSSDKAEVMGEIVTTPNN